MLYTDFVWYVIYRLCLVCYMQTLFGMLYTDASTVVKGNVSNNVFYHTINGEALRIYGNSYQEVSVLFNYIVYNRVDNLNTVDMRYVIVNVTGKS